MFGYSPREQKLSQEESVKHQSTESANSSFSSINQFGQLIDQLSKEDSKARDVLVPLCDDFAKQWREEQWVRAQLRITNNRKSTRNYKYYNEWLKNILVEKNRISKLLEQYQALMHHKEIAISIAHLQQVLDLENWSTILTPESKIEFDKVISALKRVENELEKNISLSIDNSFLLSIYSVFETEHAAKNKELLATQHAFSKLEEVLETHLKKIEEVLLMPSLACSSAADFLDEKINIIEQLKQLELDKISHNKKVFRILLQYYLQLTMDKFKKIVEQDHVLRKKKKIIDEVESYVSLSDVAESAVISATQVQGKSEGEAVYLAGDCILLDDPSVSKMDEDVVDQDHKIALRKAFATGDEAMLSLEKDDKADRAETSPRFRFAGLRQESSVSQKDDVLMSPFRY